MQAETAGAILLSELEEKVPRVRCTICSYLMSRAFEANGRCERNQSIQEARPTTCQFLARAFGAEKKNILDILPYVRRCTHIRRVRE